MKARSVAEGVSWLGTLDWDRRLFDSLIPLPDGTSYNAYLVQGSEKTALIDTTDPRRRDELLDALAGVGRLDYLVSHHTEQDHSGCLGEVLARFPGARVLCSDKARGMLLDHLHLPAERLQAVADGEKIDLGGKTLQFVYTPWVHWPETMCTYLPEQRVLFSCDFFGSHLAGSELFVRDRPRVFEAAKRYFAEIMMPFRAAIEKNLEKLRPLDISIIAPSHGPVHDEPRFILDAYREWVSGAPKNLVVLPFVSMHGSTLLMVEKLCAALVERGVGVERFELTGSDIGKLAMALVDAATLVVGTPTVLAGPHPLAAYATFLANALRPRIRFLSVVGSFGWGGRVVEVLSGLVGNLKAEVLDPVLCKGMPRAEDLERLERLAETIRQRHSVLPD